MINRKLWSDINSRKLIMPSLAATLATPADTQPQIDKYKEQLTQLIEEAHASGSNQYIYNRHITSTRNNARALFFEAVNQLCKETEGLEQWSSYVNKTMQHIALGDAYICGVRW